MINGNCSIAQAQALPQCNQDVHNDFKPLIEAMEELRTQRNCQFLGIQALGSKNEGNGQTLPSENCRSVIIGDAAARGFLGLNAEKFEFNIIGSGNQKLGTIDAHITKGMTKEAIMARLTNFDNKAKFEQFCNNSACPKNDDSSLKNLYSAIETVKNKEHCKIGKIQVMNTEFANVNQSQCALSVEGNLGSEGLTKERAPASVQVYDTEGKIISTLEIKVSSEMKTEDIVAQFDNDDIRKICIEANTAHRIDDTVAAQEVGLPDSTFVPSYWKDKMNLLRNSAVNNDIKEFRVEVDSTGSLKLFADDPNEIIRFQTEFENVLNAGRKDGGHVTFLNLGDKILVSGEPSSVRIEAIANREKITLSAPQNSLLEEFSSASTLLNFKVDDQGQVSLLTGNLDMSDKALLGPGEDFLDYKVISVERDTSIKAMPSFRYVLAPK